LMGSKEGIMHISLAFFEWRITFWFRMGYPTYTSVTI
jgi:hypothetical protein